MTFKMTHFVFHVLQKHFIITMFQIRAGRLIHIMKNKMCHFECHALNFIFLIKICTFHEISLNKHNFDDFVEINIFVKKSQMLSNNLISSI
jgi:hypothetical protein